MDEEQVLCSASHYVGKYYFNRRFERLPEQVKQELQVMCVLFTEDVGGILTLLFDEEGSLSLRTDAYDDDLLYDEIGSVLKVKQLQAEKAELFSALESFYRTFILNQE